MGYLTAFSPSYAVARSRFRDLAQKRNFRLQTYPLATLCPQGNPLTIDVAFWGDPEPKNTIIVSSGLHGVEGFLGSAVQIAWLETELLQVALPKQTSLILIHGLNPFGFAWLRRCNEENIDLNRNFLLPGAEYRGSPENYPKLDSFFNPPSPPSLLEPFLLKAIWVILGYGITTLKNTLPVGQYDFPKGLFFGGEGPSGTQRILAEHLPTWIDNAKNAIHLDLHTGLGRWATYKLFSPESENSTRVKWLQQKFGEDRVLTLTPQGDAYPTQGALGPWCQAMFPDCCYDFLTVEFGTYPIIQVVEALRAENRAHWWGQSGRPADRWAKQRLVEMFAPADARWRESVVSQGIGIMKQAINAIAL